MALEVVVVLDAFVTACLLSSVIKFLENKSLKDTLCYLYVSQRGVTIVSPLSHNGAELAAIPFRELKRILRRRKRTEMFSFKRFDHLEYH